MFCTKCGRKLAPGERCICEAGKKANEQNGSWYIANDIDGTEREYRKRGVDPFPEPHHSISINGKMIAAWFFIMAAVALYIVLRFYGNDFYDMFSILEPVKVYFQSILTLVILVVALVLAILSFHKRVMRIGSIFALLCSILLLGGFGGLLGLHIWKNTQVSELLSQEITADNISGLKAYYEQADDQDSADLILKKVEDKIKNIQLDYMNANADSDSAIAQLNELSKLGVLENSIQSTQDMITLVKASKTAFEAAVEYENNSDYLSAIDSYEAVVEDDTDNFTIAQSKITELTATYKKQLLDKANQYYDMGEYQDALAQVNDCDEILDGDADIEAMKKKAESSYADEYRKSVLAEAEAAFQNSGYEDAVAALNKGLAVLTKDSALLEKKTEYEQFRPINILDELTTITDSGNFWLNGSATDNYGNDYINVWSIDCSDGGAGEYYQTFSLDGSYRLLRGTMALEDHEKNTNYKMWLEIYSGNTKIYSTDILESGKKPISFSVDISGVTDLKISYCADDDFWGASILVPELTVQK